ncbi:MAG: hypothetical protein H6737_04010 [Alphaproteobacteria bacterium]|nr:hypothetical protein [Alphaproteobacteria bacterium]
MLTAAFATALLSSPALADEKQAEECVNTKVWDSYGDGWGVRTMTKTTLAPGKTRNYLVTLYAGNEYRIQACGDESVTNLDVLLYDTEGNLLSRDEATDREPMFSYTPSSTATYYVVLYLRELKERKDGAGVAMAVTYK